MLTKTTPKTIRTRLKITGAGVENDLLLTYHNHAPDDYEAFAKNPENLKVPEGLSQVAAINHMNAQLVLFLVESFDDGTADTFPLTRDGLIDMERHYPGVLHGLIVGYHRARGVAVEKN